MTLLEPVYEEVQPDCTVVVGDVTSTLAAALVSDIAHVPVAHVEAGLRSFDRWMPEERNRILTDHVARWLLAPSVDAISNLEREGLGGPTVSLVGNVMIDSLDWVVPRVKPSEICREYGVTQRRFALVTLHRASNVDDPVVFEEILNALNEVGQLLPLVFAVHPRTKARLEASHGDKSIKVHLVEPLPYDQFVGLLAASRMVLTDSGGIQEEAIVLGVPCLTLRETTERPITLESGLNHIVGTDTADILRAVVNELSRPTEPSPFRPPLWDGHAAERVVEALLR